MKTHYLSCAETAKLIRQALKKAFPSVTFSVKSKTYSGGASINVGWTDGPTREMVEKVAKQYQGGAFDGMIDMKIGMSHWLLPNGSTSIASNPGTVGSRGTIPEEREWMPDPNCKLVHFGADFVFCNRSYSERFLKQLKARLVRKGYRDLEAIPILPASQYMSARFERLPYELEQRIHQEQSRLMIA